MQCQEVRPAPLDPEVLRPSGALLAAQLAVASAIERNAVAATSTDTTTVDLLLRLSLSPGQSLRGVELGRQLHLDAGYVSRRIDRAEAAGLVQRTPDLNDRRAQQITLTDEGRRVIDDFVPWLEHVLQSVIFDTMTPKEIDVFTELLLRVETAARTLTDQQAGPDADHHVP